MNRVLLNALLLGLICAPAAPGAAGPGPSPLTVWALGLPTGAFAQPPAAPALDRAPTPQKHAPAPAYPGPAPVYRIGHPLARRDPDGPFAVFGGTGDAYLIGRNPLDGLEGFAVEAQIRPDADGPAAQRFLHVEDPDGRRLTLEIRILPGGLWALDTYLHDGAGRRTLRDTTLTHSTGQWHRVAMSYDGRTLRSFVDGRPELSGPVRFGPMRGGEAALGARLDRVFWFKGAIRQVRFGALRD